MKKKDYDMLRKERKQREDEIQSARNQATLDILLKCLSPRRLLPIQYPPTYDGELHIHSTPMRIGFLPTVFFSLTVRQLDGEDDWATLVRASRDVIAQEERRPKGRADHDLGQVIVHVMTKDQTFTFLDADEAARFVEPMREEDYLMVTSHVRDAAKLKSLKC